MSKWFYKIILRHTSLSDYVFLSYFFSLLVCLHNIFAVCSFLTLILYLSLVVISGVTILQNIFGFVLYNSAAR